MHSTDAVESVDSHGLCLCMRVWRDDASKYQALLGTTIGPCDACACAGVVWEICFKWHVTMRCVVRSSRDLTFTSTENLADGNHRD